MIYHIAAVTDNDAIGFENNLVTRSKEDLKNFKELTSGQVVVMGRKTFESMGSKALPNRTNVIVTSNPDFVIGNKGEFSGDIVWYLVPDECKDNLPNFLIDLLIEEYESQDKDIYIIGGGEIYKQTMDWVDELIISHFPIVAENADTFYPKIDRTIWNIAKADNREDFTIVRYVRANPSLKLIPTE